MGGRGCADICGLKQNHDEVKAGGGAEGQSGGGGGGAGVQGQGRFAGLGAHTP